MRSARTELHVEYDEALCRRLRSAMAETDLPFNRIAELAGISRSSAYKLRYGHVPSAFVLAKLARLLGLDMNELMGVQAGGARKMPESSERGPIVSG